MAKYRVKYSQAVWETTTFEVEIPDPLPDEYQEVEEYIRDHLDDFIDGEDAERTHEDEVFGIDSQIEIEELQ